MAFSAGFKKEAAAARELGRVTGKVLTAPLKATGAAIHQGYRVAKETNKGFVEGLKAGFPVKRLSPSGKIKPPHGASLAKKVVEHADEKHALKFTPETERHFARNKMLERMKDRKRGPSFISRHPLPSAIAAYAGYRALTSPPGPDQNPQIIYPQ